MHADLLQRYKALEYLNFFPCAWTKVCPLGLLSPSLRMCAPEGLRYFCQLTREKLMNYVITNVVKSAHSTIWLIKYFTICVGIPSLCLEIKARRCWGFMDGLQKGELPHPGCAESIFCFPESVPLLLPGKLWTNIGTFLFLGAPSFLS